MLINKKNNKAFSLIEVLIFVSILSIFFVAVATVTVASLRNMKINEHKILATYYAQELVEWLRDQKEADWVTFSTRAGTYCFNETPIPSNWSPTACSPLLKSFFLRQVVISVQGEQINIKITVSWDELENHYQVPLATVFTVWED
jgi:type II secretory pathway pseudopilin PulG